MKAAVVMIGAILVIGGAAGALRPKEWTYAAANRNAVAFGPTTISKAGTRMLAVGAILLGAGVIYLGKRINEK